MLKLSSVPTELKCPDCGHYIKDMRLDEAFEVLAARILQAKIAPARNEGFDVYDSELFPGKTFQVKCANAREGRKETKEVNGRLSTWNESPHWTWFEPIAYGADVYILFGIREALVYPFVVPVYLWADESYDTGNGGRILRVSTDHYSRCGRYANSAKRNKFWQYLVKTWPGGLLDIVEYYTKSTPMAQTALFPA